MKKSSKYSLILLITVVCVAVFVMTAAAQTKGPQFFNYHTTGDSLETLIYAKSDERLTKSNFTLKIGDKEYEPDSLTTYTDSNYATSWIVVIESANNYKTLENLTFFFENQTHLLIGKPNKKNLREWIAANPRTTWFTHIHPSYKFN